jgi:hypothetical protein
MAVTNDKLPSYVHRPAPCRWGGLPPREATGVAHFTLVWPDARSADRADDRGPTTGDFQPAIFGCADAARARCAPL